jgi:hypothetical protein
VVPTTIREGKGKNPLRKLAKVLRGGVLRIVTTKEAQKLDIASQFFGAAHGFRLPAGPKPK